MYTRRMSSGANLACMLAFATLAMCSTPGEDPLVTISQGQLRGKLSTSRGGRTFNAFRGIPYAAPPVGELRFKPPGPAPSWEGERLAGKDGALCPQSHMIRQKFTGSEDCLFINVFTPKVETSSEGFPVMVYIHGGGFMTGSGGEDMHGPELFMDHDIVLVTLNYRLGALGFISLESPELPGNFGLKDQVAALRWVKANIASFGGDPNLVTIFGESAGGASVHYLMLSPLSRGLFHRAIAQSGSAFNPWAFTRHTRQITNEAVTSLGCARESDTEIVNCLRALKPEKFVDVSQPKSLLDPTKKIVFVPCVEVASNDAFLPATPMQLFYRDGVADVPYMTGLTTHEGMLQFWVLKDISVEEDYKNNFQRFVPEELGLEVFSSEWNATWERIQNFYKDDNFLESYLHLNSDIDFNIGVDTTVRQTAELKRSKVFYYQFSYDGGLGLLKSFMKLKYPGTSHADELGYMFSAGLMPLWRTASEKDGHTIDRMTKLWTNFARTGNPTPDNELGVTWEPVKATGNPEDTSTRYLDIGEQLSMVKDDLNSARVKFWNEVYQNNLLPLKHDEF